MKFTLALRWILPVMALVVMALRIPIQTPWIDEAAIVTYGASAWGIPSQLSDTKVLYWLGSLFTYLFYEVLPGGMGARWFSWIGAIFLLTMWELWARQNRVQATHRAVLGAALLLLPVVQFEGSNGRLDLWAIGWAFAAFTSYQNLSSPPRIRLLLTGILAGISVAFWFTGLITLLLLPFLALTPDRSQGHFLADRFRELPLLLLGFVVPFSLMGIFRFDYMSESVEALEAMIQSRIQMGTAEISSRTFVREPNLAPTLIPTSLLWLISWGSRCPGRPGNRTPWFMEAGVVVGVFILVVVSHLYHGRLVYWLPIPFAFVALNLSAKPQALRNGLMISIAVLGFGYSMFTSKARAKRAFAPVNPTVQLERRLDAWEVKTGDLIFYCGDYHLTCYFTPAPVQGFDGTFDVHKLQAATHVFIDSMRCFSAPDATELQRLGFEKWEPSSPEDIAALIGQPATIPEVWIRKTIGNR